MAARIRLRVSPGASRSEIVGPHGAGWKIRVAAPAERGRANDEALRLLAAMLAVERGRLRLVAGATSRDKVIEVEGLTDAAVEERLDARRRKGST